MTCIEGNFIFFLNYIVLHIISLLIFLLLNLILFQSNLTSGFKRLNWADLVGGRQKTFSSWILMRHTTKWDFHFSRLLYYPSVPSFSPDEAGRNPLHRPHFHMFLRMNNSSTSSITSMRRNAVSLIFFRRTDGYAGQNKNSIFRFLFLDP